MQYRIKEICREKGINLSVLAENIGTSQASISRIITGKGNPTVDTLERIADALGVSASDLFESQSKELTALIDNNGSLYKAETIEELEKIVSELKNER